jgi:hypothetical protein
MFKKSFAVLAMVAVLFVTALAQSHSIKADRTAPTKYVPTVGERLSYDVSWSDFIVAGELTLETKGRSAYDGVDGFHVSAQAESVGLVSAVVYKVKDVYESFLNADTLQPFRAEKNSRHGKKREQGAITLDQQKRTARLADGRTIEIPAGTYDLAGLLYAIRGMDLTIGKARDFSVIEDDKVYHITIVPEAREKITTRAGAFDAIRLATKLTSGGRDSKLSNLKLYLTNDARRLPVMITAEPSWGSVRVRLTAVTSAIKK